MRELLEMVEGIAKDPALQEVKTLKQAMYRARCWEIVEDSEYEFATKEGLIKVALEDPFILSGFFYARAADQTNIVYPTPISDNVKQRIAKVEESTATINPPAMDGDVILVFWDGGNISAQTTAYWIPVNLSGSTYISQGTTDGTGEIITNTAESELSKTKFEQGALKVVYGSNILKFGAKEILQAAEGTRDALLCQAAYSGNEDSARIAGVYAGIHDLTLESLNNMRIYTRNSIEMTSGDDSSPANQKFKSLKMLVESFYIQADKLLVGAEGAMEQVLKGNTTQDWLTEFLGWVKALKDIVDAFYTGYTTHAHPSAMGTTSAPVDTLPQVQSDLNSWSTEDPDLLYDAADEPETLEQDSV